MPRGNGTRRRPPRGFTLAELLVALVLADLGLLALVATSAAVTRQLTAATERRTAVLVARNRLERLAAQPCGSASGVEPGPAGVREQWQSSPAGATQRMVDSVEYPRRGAVGTVVLRTMAPC